MELAPTYYIWQSSPMFPDSKDIVRQSYDASKHAPKPIRFVVLKDIHDNPHANSKRLTVQQGKVVYFP